MKKLLLILFLLAGVSVQAQRKVDVYYSNGIYNTFNEAHASTVELKRKLKETKFSSGPDAGKSMLDPNFIDNAVILQYNWSADEDCKERAKEEYFCVDDKAVMGYDILETYYQLKQSGQIDRALGFFGWLATMVIDTVQAIASIPGIVPSEEEIAKIESQNVDAMVDKYKEESVNQHNDILLFSHSQGNLFANRVYNVYFSKDPGGSDHYKYRFANIQIATPTDYVAAYTHDYISRADDSVISWVPGSMSPNIPMSKLDNGDCDGDPKNNHNFVHAYLDCPATWDRIAVSVDRFHNGKNGLCETCGDMPSGCSYNPNAKSYDVMLVLMSALTVLYPLYWGVIALYRRRRGYAGT